MRSTWLDDESMRLVLAAMLPANRLALEVSDATGLRIDDVLSLHTELIAKTARPYVTDSKTGKTHRIYIPSGLRVRMLQQAGKVWIWPGRIKPNERHRTRQAVYKDMVRAVAVFRRSLVIPEDTNISPHTMRKRAAVRAYQRGGLDVAAKMLQHSSNDAAITMLYALSDVQQPRARKRKPHKSGGTQLQAPHGGAKKSAAPELRGKSKRG